MHALSNSSAAEQHRQVQAALQPHEIGAQLERLFELQRGGRSLADECRILDTKYEPGQYCTILYQLGDQLLIGTFRWGQEQEEGEIELPPTARLVEPLGMQVYQFQHDPALPGLEVALDPLRMAAAFEAALPACVAGARVLRCRARPLRYRPGRRCTIRFDLVLREPGGTLTRSTLFGKVYHDLDKASSVNNEMRMLAASAPARAGRLLLADVEAFLPELMLIVQRPVAGAPLELYLEGMQGQVTAGDQRGWQGVIASANTLAALHTAGLATDRERPIEKELLRFRKRAGQAAAVDPAAGERMIALAETLPNWLDLLPEWDAEVSLIHGDCKHSQFLLTPAGPAILDFDHCGMSDPANDIGVYLATLRQIGLWQELKSGGGTAAAARKRWLRELEGSFLDAYVAASGFSPAFRLRATWYEAAALLRKALRGFARSPRSPMPAAQVEEAWRCLAELPRRT